MLGVIIPRERVLKRAFAEEVAVKMNLAYLPRFCKSTVSVVVAWLLATAAVALTDMAAAPLLHVGPQNQNANAIAANYKYDVISVKPSEPGACRGRGQFCHPTETPGGFHAVTTLETLLQRAFGVYTDDQLLGAPRWVSSLYEVDSRMDDATADALQKLSPDARKLARQQMLQALLAERFKLVVHRQTKELPVYSLFVGKNGTKLQPSSPDFRLPSGSKPAPGTSGLAISMQGPDMYSAVGIAVSMDDLVPLSAAITDRPILDETGLTGKYDFSIQFSTGDSQLGNAPGGGANVPSPVPSPLPDSGLTLLLKLGFRLESGKRPVEVITIDHIEQPTQN
jgi:uncharacterized protein (TIGR03435 family)